MRNARAAQHSPPAESGAGAPDEADAIARAKDDPGAFAPVYLRYVDTVYRYCYHRLGTREAAEDATSQVFERVLLALPSYRRGIFRAWLFTVAHNVVTDCYRATRPAAGLAVVDEMQDPTPGPEDIVLLADERRLLLAALPLLSPDQRRVMELRLTGLPSTEVATALSRSPESVRALQLRAIRRLRTLLGITAPGEEARHA